VYVHLDVCLTFENVPDIRGGINDKILPGEKYSNYII
jgi:hypothetical protein